MEKSNKLGARLWFNIILFGFMGQIAWNVENMYFNTFLCNYIYGKASAVAVSGAINITDAVAKMVALSALTAVVTTFVMGNLSDRINNRKLFISAGYILWGIVTGFFGVISLDATKKIFSLTDEVAILTATVWIVIGMDCIMTFMGSTSNDSAFNAWVTDSTNTHNRTKVETVLAMLPVGAMGFVIAVGGIIVSKVGYPTFFLLLGGIVVLCGLIGMFTIKEAKQIKKEKNSHYWADLIYGFKPSVIKENSKFYITLLTICIYSTALQVFFPYIIVYLQHSDIKFIDNIGSLLSGSNLIITIITVAIALSLLLFFVLKADRYKEQIVTVSAVLFAAGLIGAYFAKTPITFLVAVAPVLIGYAMLGIILNAVIRDFTPEDKTGLFQGVRMIFFVLIPMVLGPQLCSVATRNSNITYINDYGAQNILPSSMMFLIAGITSLFVFIPLAVILKKGIRPKQAGSEQ